MTSVPGASPERFKFDDARRFVDALGVDNFAIVQLTELVACTAHGAPISFVVAFFTVSTKRY